MVSLEVRDGQTVEEGQILAVFEDCRGLMMQTIIKSPCKGRFKLHDVQPGQNIDAGSRIFGVE